MHSKKEVETQGWGNEWVLFENPVRFANTFKRCMFKMLCDVSPKLLLTRQLSRGERNGAASEWKRRAWAPSAVQLEVTESTFCRLHTLHFFDVMYTVLLLGVNREQFVADLTRRACDRAALVEPLRL